MRMQRQLAQDYNATGTAVEATDILRGLARLIEANHANVEDYPVAENVSNRQATVARIHIVADSVQQITEAGREGGWEVVASREWMIEICRLPGVPWSHEKEQSAATEFGISQPDE